MQWHDRVKEAPGDCRSDAWWIYQLGLRFKKMAEESGLARDEGMRTLTWNYGVAPNKINVMGLPAEEGGADIDAVALEMNGVNLETKQRLPLVSRLYR